MCNMTQKDKCKTCGDVLNAPTYVENDHWFCSLDCWNIWVDAREMPDPGPRD